MIRNNLLDARSVIRSRACLIPFLLGGCSKKSLPTGSFLRWAWGGHNVRRPQEVLAVSSRSSFVWRPPDFAMVVVSLSMLQILSVINTPTQEPLTQSDENLEETMRGWADSFGWGTRPLQGENALVAFQVSLYNDTVRVPIIQSEQLAGFLTIRINLALSNEERKQFLNLEQHVANSTNKNASD